MSKMAAKIYAQAYWQKAIKEDKAKIDELAKNLIALMIKKNDLKKVPSVFKELNKLEDDYLKRIRAEVATARPLAKDDKIRLTQEIKKASKCRQVLIDDELDTRLMGGMRVQIGWQVIDNTLAGRLTRLKEKLI